MIKISVLNLPLFIYNKLKSSSDKSNISSRIIKIAIFSVFLGVFISLCSISIGKGLQISIKDKLYSLNEGKWLEIPSNLPLCYTKKIKDQQWIKSLKVFINGFDKFLYRRYI